jgi:hypothetical protein
MKKQLGCWKELMKAPGDAFIHVRIGITKNDPHGSVELPQRRILI